MTDARPTCQDASTKTQQDTPVDIEDLFVFDDPDDDDLTIGWGGGRHGMTDDQGTTYFPSPGFVGIDQVTFQADDGALSSRVCAITITVTAPPVVQPPVVQLPVVQPPPPPPADVTKPAFTAAHPTQSLTNARTTGIKLTSTSDEAGTLVVTVKVDKATARRLKIKRKAKRAVTVGTLTQAIAAGNSAVTVKLTKKARKALMRTRKVKLLITTKLSDAAGNATARSMTVTLKR